MSNNLLHIARQHMPPADGKTEIIHSVGDTQDIVQEVLETHRLYYNETDQFAENLQGADNKETAKNIWAFLRKAVEYRLDPEGEQFTKSPSRVISDGFSDCKGYSIFAASVLENLGIPYFFRFVDYSLGSDTPTHVYVVAKGAGEKESIPLDACWQFFGKEKKYTYVQDEIPMTRISRLSGIGNNTLLEGQLQLDLMLERLRLEKQILNRVSGIGSPYHSDYNEAIQYLQRLQSNPTLLYSHVGGIGGFSDFVKKVADKVKSGVQAFKNAITEPQKVFGELLLKTLLPAASPFFVYLFVQDPQQIAKLPTPVKTKRDKMFRVAANIIKAVGMDEGVFMSILRNGIMKSLQKTPEQVITDAAAGKVSGIGFAWGAIIQTVITIITKVVALFKGAKESLAASDAPDLLNDFRSSSGGSGSSGSGGSGSGGSGSGGSGSGGYIPEAGNGPLPPGMLPKGSGDSGSGGSSGGVPSTGILIGLGLLALLSLK
ncbi:MAG: hypothetical protein SF052_15735 [Bacteroidia bacterium]|nr:hypothetical protein [Bacteroidia bacterium]